MRDELLFDEMSVESKNAHRGVKTLIMRVLFFTHLVIYSIQSYSQGNEVKWQYRSGNLNLITVFNELQMEATNIDSVKFNPQSAFSEQVSFGVVLEKIQLKKSRDYLAFLKDVEDMKISKEAIVSKRYQITPNYDTYILTEIAKEEFYTETHQYMVNISENGYAIIPVSNLFNTGLSASFEFAEVFPNRLEYYRMSLILDLPNAIPKKVFLFEKKLSTDGKIIIE